MPALETISITTINPTMMTNLFIKSTAERAIFYSIRYSREIGWETHLLEGGESTESRILLCYCMLTSAGEDGFAVGARGLGTSYRSLFNFCRRYSFFFLSLSHYWYGLIKTSPFVFPLLFLLDSCSVPLVSVSWHLWSVHKFVKINKIMKRYS